MLIKGGFDMNHKKRECFKVKSGIIFPPPPNDYKNDQGIHANKNQLEPLAIITKPFLSHSPPFLVVISEK